MIARVPALRPRLLGAVALAALALLVMFAVASPVRAQGTLSALQTDVDQLARRARPSVVTVLAQRTVRSHVAASDEPEQRVHTRVGSGVAIEEHGILTTASVVLGAERLVVRTANGLLADAELVGVDPIANVALLRVPTLRLPVLRFAADHSTTVGDWVVSLGTSYRAQPTQSVGNVAYRHHEPNLTLLQLTNTVYPGNSGAAALNTSGELLGIVQGELGAPELTDGDRGGEQPGAGSFVLPIETVRPVIEALKRDGRVRHGFLGVTTRAISVASVDQRGARQPIGAVVEAIVPGSPAEKLGLRRGDLIVAYARERVEYPEQLARWVASTAPGQPVEVVWVREEIGMNGSATLTESPDAVPAWMAQWPDDEDVAPSTARIGELQREIKRLSGELTRLKTKPSR